LLLTVNVAVMMGVTTQHTVESAALERGNRSTPPRQQQHRPDQRKREQKKK